MRMVDCVPAATSLQMGFFPGKRISKYVISM